MGNINGSLGTASAVMALIFLSIEITRESFVEVFLVTGQDGDSFVVSDISIAGLGVFTTTYDPTELQAAEAEAFAASGIPDGVRESRTTEFPLLFPAQENFVVDVLPIQRADISQFGNAFGPTTGPIAVSVIEQILTPIEELQFTDCAQYVPDAEEALENFFNTLNGLLLPQINGIVFEELLDGLTEAFNGLVDGFGFDNIFGGLIFTTLSFPESQLTANILGTPGCAALGANLRTTPLDADKRGCVADAYTTLAGEIAATNPILSAFLNDLAARVNSCGTLTLDQCFGSIATQVNDAPPNTVISFNTTGTSFCEVWNGCAVDSATLDVYIAATGLFQDTLAYMTTNIDTPSEPQIGLMTGMSGLIEAFVAYSFALQYQVYSPLLPLGAFDADALIPETFPANTFEEFYLPCAMLQMAQELEQLVDPSYVIPSLSDTPGTCGFTGYFNLVVEAAVATDDTEDDALIPLLTELNVLYGACEALGKAPALCGDVFAALFMSGAYSRGLDTTVLAVSANNAPVFEEALEKCTEDEEDLDILYRAQFFVVFAVFSISVSITLAVAAFFLPYDQFQLFSAASLAAALSFIMNLGGLFIARTAPVFEVVGEGPTTLYEPVYENGDLTAFAFVSLGFAVVAAIFFGAAARYAYLVNQGQCGGYDEDESEVLEGDEAKEV